MDAKLNVKSMYEAGYSLVISFPSRDTLTL